MRYFLIIIILLFYLAEVSSQTISISVNNINQNKAQLSYLRGEDVIVIDSVFPAVKGKFNYTFAKNANHPGLYRLSFTDSSWIDFVFDRKEVIMATNADNLLDSMKVINSESNKLYYDFLKLSEVYKTKTERLLNIISKYSTDDENYIDAKNKLVQLQEQYLHFVNITAQEDKKSFIARYIHSIQASIFDFNSGIESQKTYLKTHYLDNVDFADDDLIYSDVFTNKLKDYLALFKNAHQYKDILEKEYMSVVDIILNKAKVNELVYQDVTGYLINEFKEFGDNEVIVYIMDNYVVKDDLCVDEQLRNSIQRRIDQSKRFKAGAEVPDIVIPDSTGKAVDLMDIKSEKTLIIFFASWCPHCQRILPKLNDFYRNLDDKRLKIFAVSIDTSRTEWLTFIRKNNFNWINVSDLKGGSGKAVGDYLLYATPSMFLVNDKKEIIALPTSIDEIKKHIN